jgi:hypothetical protein
MHLRHRLLVVLVATSVSVGAASSVPSVAYAEETAPRTETTGGKSAGPWVLTGFSAAVVATGIGLYVVGSNKVAEGEARPIPRNDPVPAATQKVSDITVGRSMQTVGIVGGVLGVAGVAGGLIWHFSESKERTVQVAPSAAYGYGGVALSGRF